MGRLDHVFWSPTSVLAITDSGDPPVVFTGVIEHLPHGPHLAEV